MDNAPMYSLQKLVWTALLITAVFLAIIMLFGVRQYVLSGQYGSLISENEEALFRFATIRESLTEIVIEDDFSRVERLVPEIEKLNASFSMIQENPLIPNEFKLSFADRVDLTGMVVRIRRMAHKESSVEERRELYADLRAIADHLLKYDRLIVGEARSRMLNLQMVIIGSMGIMISLASFFLILVYRNNVLPLSHLSTQLGNRDVRAEDITGGPSGSQELVELTGAVRSLLGEKEEAARQGEKRGVEREYAVIAEKINETTNHLNGIINYAQILADTESGGLTGHDLDMVEKIIVSGNEIAQSWHEILREGQHDG